MPNRMLRDWTDSDKMKEVSVHGERLFLRLIMKADDYGCLYADASLLKASLFPFLLNEVREADISRWMAECQKAGLIVLYEVAGKKYLQVQDFRQRLDRAKNKYPLPTSWQSLTITNDFPAEVETEQNRTEARTARADLSKSNLFKQPNIPSWELVKETFAMFKGTEEMAKAFFETHESTGWFLKGSPITNYAPLVGKWITSWRKNEQGKGSRQEKPENSVAEQIKALRAKTPAL